jgi:hypothetical protein
LPGKEEIDGFLEVAEGLFEETRDLLFGLEKKKTL